MAESEEAQITLCPQQMEQTASTLANDKSEDFLYKGIDSNDDHVQKLSPKLFIKIQLCYWDKHYYPDIGFLQDESYQALRDLKQTEFGDLDHRLDRDAHTIC